MSEAFSWPWNQLGDILAFHGSGATPRGGKDSYKSDGIPLVRSMNVYDLSFDNDNLAFIDESQAADLRRVTIDANDVLLNITGASVARCCLAPYSVVGGRVNQHVMILRFDKSKADPRFVARALAGPYKRKLLSLAGSGSTREALTKADIESFEISLPPVRLQRIVGQVLDAYAELIEINRRRIEVLEEMARLLYREWFVHFRFPGHEDVELEDSELGPIPEGWDLVALGAVLDFHGSGATPRGGKESYKTEGVPLVRSMNVHDLRFDEKGLAFIDASQAADLQRVTIEPDDVLLNITGASVARCSLAPPSVAGGRVNQHVMILRFDRSRADPMIVAQALAGPYKSKLLSIAGSGATREALEDVPFAVEVAAGGGPWFHAARSVLQVAVTRSA